MSLLMFRNSDFRLRMRLAGQDVPFSISVIKLILHPFQYMWQFFAGEIELFLCFQVRKDRLWQNIHGSATMPGYQFHRIILSGFSRGDWCNMGGYPSRACLNSNLMKSHSSKTFTSIVTSNWFKISYRSCWHHHQTLCKISKWSGSCTISYGQRRFHKILFEDEIWMNIHHSSSPHIFT